MARNITVTQSVTEDIVAIYELPGVHVRVCVAPVKSDGTMVNGAVFEEIEISGDAFRALMAANPPWAPGKPTGTYRNEDLWVFVDKFRAEKEAGNA